jgi:hypothetical protein
MLEVDKDESFDYKKGKSDLFTIKDYITLIDNEIILVQKERYDI